MVVVVTPIVVRFEGFVILVHASTVNESEFVVIVQLAQLAHAIHENPPTEVAEARPRRSCADRLTFASTLHFSRIDAMISRSRTSILRSGDRLLNRTRMTNSRPSSVSSSAEASLALSSITGASSLSTIPAGSMTSHSGTLYSAPLSSYTLLQSWPLGHVHPWTSNKVCAVARSPSCKASVAAFRHCHT